MIAKKFLLIGLLLALLTPTLQHPAFTNQSIVNQALHVATQSTLHPQNLTTFQRVAAAIFGNDKPYQAPNGHLVPSSEWYDVEQDIDWQTKWDIPDLSSKNATTPENTITHRTPFTFILNLFNNNKLATAWNDDQHFIREEFNLALQMAFENFKTTTDKNREQQRAHAHGFILADADERCMLESIDNLTFIIHAANTIPEASNILEATRVQNILTALKEMQEEYQQLDQQNPNDSKDSDDIDETITAIHALRENLYKAHPERENIPSISPRPNPRVNK